MAKTFRMEQLVRPFEQRDIGPAKIINAPLSVEEESEDEEPKTVKFDWGRGGGTAGKIVNSVYKLGVKRYMTKRQMEQDESE